MGDHLGAADEETHSLAESPFRPSVRAATIVLAIGLFVFVSWVGEALAWPFLPGYDGYHLANYHLEWHYGSNFTGSWQNRAQDAVNTWTCCDGTDFHWRS